MSESVERAEHAHEEVSLGHDQPHASEATPHVRGESMLLQNEA
jgi:hypothetical protein